MDISNPRRLLAVSLTSSEQLLSRFIKGMPIWIRFRTLGVEASEAVCVRFPVYLLDNGSRVRPIGARLSGIVRAN